MKKHLMCLSVILCLLSQNAIAQNSIVQNITCGARGRHPDITPHDAQYGCIINGNGNGSIEVNHIQPSIFTFDLAKVELYNKDFSGSPIKTRLCISHDGYVKFDTLSQGDYGIRITLTVYCDNTSYVCNDDYSPIHVGETTAGCSAPIVTHIDSASSPLCNDGVAYMSNGDVFYNLHPGAQTVGNNYVCYCGTKPYNVSVNVPSKPCNFNFSAIATGPIQNCSPGSLLLTASNTCAASSFNISIKDNNSSTVYTNTISNTDFPYKISMPLGGHYTVTVNANATYGQCSVVKGVDIPLQSVNFYQVAYSQSNATKHGFHDGSITASPSNDSNIAYLHFWNIPYQDIYTYYLYDALGNFLANGQSVKPFTFSGLAAGKYIVQTIGTRYDAQACSVPQNKTITVTEPSCTIAVTATTSTIQQCSANITGNVTNFSGTAQLTLAKKNGAVVATTTSTNGIYIFSGLNNGTYKVTATDSFNCSASAEATVTNQFCPVPTGLIFVKINDTRGTVSWLPIDCSLGYNFQYRQKYPVSQWITYKLNGPSSTSKVLTGLFPGVVYEYQVRSICTSKSNSNYSPVDTFCTICPSSLAKTANSSAEIASLKTISNEEMIMTIFPNPGKKTIYLKFNNEIKGTGSLIINDALGQAIFTRNDFNFYNNVSVDVSKFRDGVYWIVAIINGKRMTAKLIIQQ